MSERFVPPATQWISALGVPLAGAKLYFYTAGTATPLNTYSDAALTIPNTNPVIADANGVWAPIFMSSATYKVDMKTALGAQVAGFPIDNLSFSDDNFVMPERYGAVGDGATDDSAALQACITANRAVKLDAKTYYYTGVLTIPANTKLIGSGPSSKLSGDNVIKMDISVANVQLSDFSFIGDGSRVITVGKNGTASNVTIERVNFVPTVANHLDNCVALYTCSNVRIDKCNFVSTGYGVIQIAGFVCSAIKVTGCYFSDMYGDAVLLNGAGSVATDVLIDSNTFTGSHDWTTPATERRFVGVTSAYGVRITNNFVTQCAGDAGIHLEDVGGRTTISDNIFIDCGVSGGNDGFIYILNSAKTLIISNNWFVRTSTSAGSAFISTISGVYTDELLIECNDFTDTSGHHVIACNLASHTGLALIKNNYCSGCDQFVQVINADGVAVDSNSVLSTNYGVYSSNVTVASGTGGSNIEVRNNTFYCLTYSIRTGKNTSATNGPVSWLVANNAFKTGDVLGAGGTDIWMTGNKAGSGLTNFTMASAAVARCVETNWNFKDGTGIV